MYMKPVNYIPLPSSPPLTSPLTQVSPPPTDYLFYSPVSVQRGFLMYPSYEYT
jgi:hypothetical protein